jgi:membrane protease YdiL (CAAX protease family)
LSEPPVSSEQNPPERFGPGQLYRLSWFFYLFLAIAGVLWIGVREGTIPISLFIDRESWWIDLAIGVAAAGALLGLWSGMRTLSSRARALERRIGELLGPLEPAEVAALALLSGFAEELLFRGAMQGSWGFVVTTVIFALVHTGPGPAYRFWTLFAAVAGALLGGLMLWRGNLLAPVVAHILVNGVNLARLDREGAEEPSQEPNEDGGAEPEPRA